jgi:hypothetical protein
MDITQVAFNFDLSAQLAAVVPTRSYSSFTRAWEALKTNPLKSCQEKVIYCEGWVTDGHTQQIEHAWLEINGDIVDPTPAFYLHPYRYYVPYVRLDYGERQSISPVTVKRTAADQLDRAVIEEARERAQREIDGLTDYQALFCQHFGINSTR